MGKGKPAWAAGTFRAAPGAAVHLLRTFQIGNRGRDSCDTGDGIANVKDGNQVLQGPGRV